jgi:cytochrome d ubiquinol oxidase subunit I
LQILAGDLHGLNTFEHQPAKIAAMEGLWETEHGADLRLFAVPDEKNRSNRFEISIPDLGSIILTHERKGEVRGLNEFPGNHPPVAPVFYAFRIMVGIGVLMLLTGWTGAWQLRRAGQPQTWLARVLMWMTFSGWVAVLAGWYTTEIGRQPWLVYGVLNTAQAAAANVSGGMITATLIMYLALYALLIAAFIAVVFHLARHAGEPLSKQGFSYAAVSDAAAEKKS